MSTRPHSFKLIIRLFLAALIVLLAFASNSLVFAGEGVLLPEQNTASGLPSADIEVFVRSGCPHCAEAELFLQALKREQPVLRIVIHDISQDPAHLDRLQNLAKNQGMGTVRVPAFQVDGQLIIGYSDELTTGQLIRGALAQGQLPAHTPKNQDTSGSCEAQETLSCEAGAEVSAQVPHPFMLDFFGHRL